MVCKEFIMTSLLVTGIVLVTGFAFTWLLLQAATVSTLYSASSMADDEWGVVPVVSNESASRQATEWSRGAIRSSLAREVDSALHWERIAAPSSPAAVQA
jgi:hypothetical protein